MKGKGRLLRKLIGTNPIKNAPPRNLDWEYKRKKGFPEEVDWLHSRVSICMNAINNGLTEEVDGY